MSKSIFQERQTFNQWTVWLIIIACITAMGYQIWENGTSNLSEFLIPLTVFSLVILLFLNIRLKTRIDEHGIHVQMFPFHLRQHLYSWSNIYSVEVLEYNPLGDYGGWGYRISFRGKGKAFSTRGNKGIKIQTSDGKTRMIGTQKEKEARTCIQQYFDSKTT